MKGGRGHWGNGHVSRCASRGQLHLVTILVLISSCLFHPAGGEDSNAVAVWVPNPWRQKEPLDPLQLILWVYHLF